MESIRTEGWGKVIEISENKDWFMLGYQSSLGERDVQAIKGKILPVYKTLTIIGHIFGSHVEMIYEVD